MMVIKIAVKHQI